jgi:hypothetical protein
VTISGSITIDCTPFIGGVLAAGTNAVNVNAAGIVVILRGLDIEGVGTGLIGVNLVNGSALHIERCRIFGFKFGAARGVSFMPPSGTTGAGAGAVLQPVSTGVAKPVFTRVTVNNNDTGIAALGNGATGDIRATIEDSIVAGSTNHGILANSAAAQSFTRIMIDRTAW